MRPIVWSAAAQRDVARIYRYLAQFNLPAAQCVVAGIRETALILRQHPHAGRSVSGGKRELVAGSYVIVYRLRTDKTRVLRVWHGAQDRPS